MPELLALDMRGGQPRTESESLMSVFVRVLAEPEDRAGFAPQAGAGHVLEAVEPWLKEAARGGQRSPGS